MNIDKTISIALAIVGILIGYNIGIRTPVHIQNSRIATSPYVMPEAWEMRELLKGVCLNNAEINAEIEELLPTNHRMQIQASEVRKVLHDVVNNCRKEN